MAWAYFQNQAAFDKYHNQVCVDNGIPEAGYNQGTGNPAILDTWTDSFIQPIQVKSTGNVTTWVGHIPDDHLVTYAGLLGLTAMDAQVTFNVGVDGLPDGTVTVQGRGTYTLSPNTLSYKKTKPATWTDPHTNITYNTTTGLPV